MVERAHTHETQSGEGSVLSRRAALRLAGIAAGGLLTAGALGTYNVTVPAENVHGPDLYNYISNRAKFKSCDFMLANRLDDSLLVFGSSELAVQPSNCPQSPHAIFGWHDHGIDLWTVGEGYNQSMWHAIAMGAYSQALSSVPEPSTPLHSGVFDGRRTHKAVFIISPQWFFEGGVPNNATQTQFGYGLWQLLCSNPHIDSAHIDYLAQRLISSGVDATQVRAAQHTTIFDTLNDLAYGFSAREKVKTDLMHTREIADSMPYAKQLLQAEEGVPDWDVLTQEAVVDAQATTTTNDYGILDSYWLKHNQTEYETGKLKGFFSNRSLLKAPTEESDLDCALSIATDCGLDLLCVLQPFAGDWVDYECLSYDDRQERYQRIRQAVESHGHKLADFSDQEYTKYFTFDGTHLGWLGWLAVERAIYEFAMGA